MELVENNIKIILVFHLVFTLPKSHPTNSNSQEEVIFMDKTFFIYKKTFISKNFYLEHEKSQIQVS